MKTKLFIFAIFFAFGELFICLPSGNLLISQSINGKLGISGQFIIRDTTNTFLTVPQNTGYLNLNRSLVIPNTTGSTIGVIYKGANSFLHNYGTDNMFIGINSGNFTMTGTNNSAFGNASLTFNTTGYQNSAFGDQSLYVNTTGNRNSAFGLGSLTENTSGYSNSAFGMQSLTTNDEGYQNSAFGESSLFMNTTGNQNSAFGVSSLSSNFMGNNNTAIGYNAQVPSGTSSNQVRIGNLLVTYAGVQVPWTITSDRRWKQNILPVGLGLGFISRLNPVSYTRINDESGKTEYGLIAQEVEEALKETGTENTGMITVTDEGMYELRYNDLLAPMVKAIQELKAEKDNEIAKLKTENVELKDRLTKFEEMQNMLVNEIEKIKAKDNDIMQVKLGE